MKKNRMETLISLLLCLLLVGVIPAGAFAISYGTVKDLAVMNTYGYSAATWISTESNRAYACAAAYMDMGEEFQKAVGTPTSITIAKETMSDGVTGYLVIDFVTSGSINETVVYPTGYQAVSDPSSTYIIGAYVNVSINMTPHYSVPVSSFSSALQALSSTDDETKSPAEENENKPSTEDNEITKSGTCGTNLTWELKNDTLTISGTGAMTDYAFGTSPAPWQEESFSTLIVNDGVTSIGNYAFCEVGVITHKIINVSLPNSITKIGEHAFYNCRNMVLDSLPSNLQSIGNSGLGECKRLTISVLPTGLVKVGMSAFIGCEEVQFEVPVTLSEIGESAFMNCKKLKGVNISPSISSIPSEAFSNCYSITEITIPATVKTIGDQAFYRCSKLSSVTMEEGCTTIGGNAFALCKLTNLTLPQTAVTIETGAFYGNVQLTCVKMNKSASIGTDAFRDCSSNLVFTYYEEENGENNQDPISESETIQENTASTVLGTLNYSLQDLMEDDSKKAMAAVSIIIPFSEKLKYDLVENKTLWSVDAGIGTDHQYFYVVFCYMPYSGGPNYAYVARWIPGEETYSVSYVGSYSDYLDTELFMSLGKEKNHILKTYPSLTNEFALYYQKLESLSSTNQDDAIVVVNGAVIETDTESKTAKVIGAENKKVASVTIPNTVTASDGTVCKVTEISDSSFKGLTKLTSVSIGKNVKKIGKMAFYNCTGLRKIGGGAGIISIGDSAFAGDKKLKSVPAFSKLETIGKSAFQSCIALTSFTIGSKVKSIGKKAFYGDKKLKTITIKSTLLTKSLIGSNAFKNIYSKATIKCPKKKLDDYKTILLKKGATKKMTIK